MLWSGNDSLKVQALPVLPDLECLIIEVKKLNFSISSCGKTNVLYQIMKERNLQLNLVCNKICWLSSALKRNIHKKIKLRLKKFQEHGSNFFFYLLYLSTPPKERQNRNCSLSLSLSFSKTLLSPYFMPFTRNFLVQSRK